MKIENVNTTVHHVSALLYVRLARMYTRARTYSIKIIKMITLRNLERPARG